MLNKTLKGKKLAFTLVELLIVIIIIAVLAAIAIPKFANSGMRGKESALRADLKMYRNAIDLFKTDTGAYPSTLADLAATSAPAKGKDSAGNDYSITASDWKGPYVQSITTDPIAGTNYTYSVTSPNVGKITSSASGKASDGSNYSDW
jgi:general secretion pathway protein G